MVWILSARWPCHLNKNWRHHPPRYRKAKNENLTLMTPPSICQITDRRHILKSNTSIYTKQKNHNIVERNSNEGGRIGCVEEWSQRNEIIQQIISALLSWNSNTTGFSFHKRPTDRKAKLKYLSFFTNSSKEMKITLGY